MHRSGRCIAILVGLLWLAAPARAATITFGSALVNQGDTFSVDVSVVGAVDLLTFGFDVTFDPNVVSFVSVSPGPDFDPNLNPNAIFDPGFPVGSDTISSILGGVVPPPAINGNAALATLSFTALATGAGQTPSGIVITNPVFLDSAGNATLPCVGDDEEPCLTIENGAIDVARSTAVPEPASLALFGLGLLALSRRLR